MASPKRSEDCCGGEFKCSNFGLDYHDPDALVSRQWGRPSISYAIYRTVVAIYFFTWLVITWVEAWPTQGIKQFIKLTEWSFDMLTISLLLRCVLACVATDRQSQSGGRTAFGHMHWILKASWVLYNISSCVALITSLFYWILIYNSDRNTTSLDWARDLTRHAVQSVLVLVDIFITGMPLRLYHLFHAWIYSLIYTIFTAIYNLVPGGTPVYPVLDWRNAPGKAAAYSLGLALIGTAVSWVLLYGLYRLRLCIFQCSKRDARTTPSSVPSRKQREVQMRQDYHPQDHVQSKNIHSGPVTRTSVVY